MNEPEPVTIAQFAGLVLEIGRTSVPIGAMTQQTNVTCEERGVLQTRPGLKPVRFASE